MNRFRKSLFILTALVLSSCAGPGKQDLQNAYTLAKRNGDINAATSFAYLMLAQDTMNLAVKDTLAQLYYARQAWPQTEAFASQLLNHNPNDTINLLRVAESRQRLGKYQQALEDYQKYYKMKPSAIIQYQIALAYVNLNNPNSAFETANQIQNDPNAQKELVSIEFRDEAGSPRMQFVPVLSAALNLKGVLLSNAGQKDNAKQLFADAVRSHLAIMQNRSNFLLAFENLSKLDRDMAMKILQDAQGPPQAGMTPQGGMAPQGMAPQGMAPQGR